MENQEENENKNLENENNVSNVKTGSRLKKGSYVIIGTIVIAVSLATNALWDFLTSSDEEPILTDEPSISDIITPETVTPITPEIEIVEEAEEVEEIIKPSVPFVSTLSFDERVDLFYENIRSFNITRDMVADLFNTLDGNPMENSYNLIDFLIKIDEVAMAINDNTRVFENIAGGHLPIGSEINIVPVNLFSSNELIAPLFDEINDLRTTIFTIQDKTNPEVIAAAQRLMDIWALTTENVQNAFEMTNGKEINVLNITNPGDQYAYHRVMLDNAAIIHQVLGSEFGIVTDIDRDANRIIIEYGRLNPINVLEFIDGHWVNVEVEVCNDTNANIREKQFNFSCENDLILTYNKCGRGPKDVNINTIQIGDIVDSSMFIQSMVAELLSPCGSHLEPHYMRLRELIRDTNTPWLPNPIVGTTLADCETPLKVNAFTHSLLSLVKQAAIDGNLKDIDSSVFISDSPCLELTPGN